MELHASEYSLPGKPITKWCPVFISLTHRGWHAVSYVKSCTNLFPMPLNVHWSYPATPREKFPQYQGFLLLWSLKWPKNEPNWAILLWHNDSTTLFVAKINKQPKEVKCPKIFNRHELQFHSSFSFHFQSFTEKTAMAVKRSYCYVYFINCFICGWFSEIGIIPISASCCSKMLLLIVTFFDLSHTLLYDRNYYKKTIESSVFAFFLAIQSAFKGNDLSHTIFEWKTKKDETTSPYFTTAGKGKGKVVKTAGNAIFVPCYHVEPRLNQNIKSYHQEVF